MQVEGELDPLPDMTTELVKQLIATDYEWSASTGLLSRLNEHATRALSYIFLSALHSIQPPANVRKYLRLWLDSLSSAASHVLPRAIRWHAQSMAEHCIRQLNSRNTAQARTAIGATDVQRRWKTVDFEGEIVQVINMPVLVSSTHACH